MHVCTYGCKYESVHIYNIVHERECAYYVAGVSFVTIVFGAVDLLAKQCKGTYFCN